MSSGNTWPPTAAEADDRDGEQETDEEDEHDDGDLQPPRHRRPVVPPARPQADDVHDTDDPRHGHEPDDAEVEQRERRCR